VANSSERPALPASKLAHELLNKLSIILENCELAMEQTLANSPSAKHLSLIQENAWFMAKELQKLQCELSHLLGPNVWEKGTLSPAGSNTKLQ
jgi:hypothetical protein